MTAWSEAFVASVVDGLAAAAVPADAGPMAASMRDRFPFLGVKAPAQRKVFGAALAAAGRRSTRPRSAVVAFVDGPGAGVLSALSRREALKNVGRTPGQWRR